MKKFLIISIIIMIFVLGFNYLVYYKGYYINFNENKEIDVQYKTQNKKIYKKNKENVYEDLIIKGINLSSSKPGHNSTEYAISKNEWLKWFSQIKNMGSNTIRIYTIYNDTFYDAFYEYNSKRDDPLYLMQGIDIPNSLSKDDYSKKLYDDAIDDFYSAVDVVHGKKNIFKDEMKGGQYRKDISKWVMGYIIGNEWDSKTIAYTNHNKGELKYLNGKYFKTAASASRFEVLLAKVMDDMICYESQKYKNQRLISFINDPQNDPFEYDDFYAKKIYKYNNIDIENIIPTNNLESGYFASYQLYKFCPGFINYFSKTQKEKLSVVIQNQSDKLFYEGYTQILSRYHTMPVIITGYEFSSARGTDYSEGTLDEEGQGKSILSVYNDIIDSGCKGAFVGNWQDEWENSTWNTVPSIDATKTFLWHDLMSKEQGNGLLSFDSSDKKSAQYVDGKLNDWNKKDQVNVDKNSSISFKYDESAIYLLIKKKGLKETDSFFIPIDITPKSGSKICNDLNVSFSRNADFLIHINGREDSKILVQERYDWIRANYLQQIDGDNPYIDSPSKSSSKFEPIRTLLKNTKIVTPLMNKEEIREAHLYKTHEVGKLIYGNGDPYNDDYNSLADFCYGTEFLEIRLPWQMLNFYNPANMEIHNDYYENYGIEGMEISKLYVGICEHNQKKPASMFKFDLKGWGKEVSYQERLKRSYYIIKESWKK